MRKWSSELSGISLPARPHSARSGKLYNRWSSRSRNTLRESPHSAASEAPTGTSNTTDECSPSNTWQNETKPSQPDREQTKDHPEEWEVCGGGQGLCRGPEAPRGCRGAEKGQRVPTEPLALALPASACPQGLCRLPRHPLRHPLGSLRNSHDAIPFSWTNIGERVQSKAKLTPFSFWGTNVSVHVCTY